MNKKTRSKNLFGRVSDSQVGGGGRQSTTTTILKQINYLFWSFEFIKQIVSIQ